MVESRKAYENAMAQMRHDHLVTQADLQKAAEVFPGLDLQIRVLYLR